MKTVNDAQIVEEIISAEAEKIVEICIEEQKLHSDQQIPIKKTKSQFQTQAKSVLQNQFDVTYKGLKTLTSILEANKHGDKEIQNFLDAISNKQNRPKNLSFETSIGDQLHLSQKFYQTAFELAKHEALKDPKKGYELFYALIVINPLAYGFWLGLATQAHMLENFEEAAFLYSYICEIFPDAKEPYFLAAQEMEKLHDSQQARHILEKFLERFENSQDIQKSELDFVRARLKKL